MLAFITKSFLGRSTRKKIFDIFACVGYLLAHKKFLSWDEKKQTKENFSVTKKFMSNDNLHLCPKEQVREGRCSQWSHLYTTYEATYDLN